MPSWPRIQVTSREKTSVTTNWRSSSEMGEVDDGAARLPVVGEQQALGIERLALAPRGEGGEATSALSVKASFVRSAGGKNWSTSKTPSLRIGGAWISPIRVPRSRSRPARHACSIRFESSTCSRLASGSAAIPTSARRLVTVPSISSRIVSESVSQRGARSEPTTFSGTPALEPGV